MKTLANCKPSEFLAQTNKIRKAVSKWLTETEILNIRSRLPQYETVPKNATAEERAEVIKRNAAAEREQTRKNITAMLDAMLDDHPEETLEVISLCCFIDPADIDNHSVGELLTSVAEIINDEAVLSFFTSLARLGRTNILNTAKA